MPEEVEINWSYVKGVVKEAALEMGWDIGWSIETEENLVIIRVKEDQDDLVAETTFDFYALAADSLGKEVFRAINFLFVSDD